MLTLSTITIDLNKLGYKALANLYIKVSNRSKMSEIYPQLLQISNLIVIIRLIGSYDLYAVIALEDFEKMFEANAFEDTNHLSNRRIRGAETNTCPWSHRECLREMAKQGLSAIGDL